MFDIDWNCQHQTRMLECSEKGHAIMPDHALLEIGRELWKLIMSRPITREVHANYVGTTDFMTIDDDLEKIRAQVRILEEGVTLTTEETAIATQIKASVDALSQSRLRSVQLHV